MKGVLTHLGYSQTRAKQLDAGRSSAQLLPSAGITWHGSRGCIDELQPLEDCDRSQELRDRKARVYTGFPGICDSQPGMLC